MLPSTIHNNESCIINIQDYFAGNGTHWVCVYNDPKSKDVDYFDSFGLHPADCIVEYMDTAGKGIVYNDVDIQSIDSIMCGYYCCYYIIQRFKGRKPLDILLEFDQRPTQINENIIKQFAFHI